MSKVIFSLVFFQCIFGCMQTQSNNNKINQTASITVNDSLAFLKLTIDLLKWHETDFTQDFPVKSNNDSIYTEIDWPVHKNRIFELNQTGFFSAEFMENYQNIALHIDKQLKQNSIKYYKGQLPPYKSDANEWCNCQDYPTNIWSKLIIKQINFSKGDKASYYWTWGDEFIYSIKVNKNNGVWKISYLQGFDLDNYTW